MMPALKPQPKSAFLELALRYVFELGYPVFPVNPVTKAPLVAGGWKAATLDVGQLVAWSEVWPNAMCGIPCGDRVGFFIVDVDVHRDDPVVDGFTSLAELVAKHGELPAGPRIKTPGGGEHRPFKMPAGIKIANRAPSLAKGIDVRSNGGFVVAPGSVRADGKVYAFKDNLGFDDIPDAPLWLVFLAAFNKKRRERLAAAGIKGHEDFNGLPPAEWEAKARELLKPKVPTRPAEPLTDDRRRRLIAYAQSGIAAECDLIASAEEGTRDATVNTAALCVWSLLKGLAVEGVDVDDLQEGAYQQLVDATELLGDGFDEEMAREKWERCLEDADPRDLSHVGVRADALTEFEAVADGLPDIIFPRLIKGRGDEQKPDPNQLANVAHLLRCIGVTVRMNTFSGTPEIDGLDGYEYLNDAALNRLWAIARAVHLGSTFDTFTRLVFTAADDNRFHPIVDYLEALRWDGSPRVDTWLHTYAGAADTPLHSHFGRTFLLGAVHRVLQPGCKFDYALVLEGPQNAGKSAAASILGGQWFGDNLRLGQDAKTTIEQTRGRWIVELPELSGMQGREVEAIKAQITTQVDRARPAYGRLTEEVPRQFVMLGTTNSGAYLRDQSGNRRFLPVEVGKMALAALSRDRDQLWAEAFKRAKAGEGAMLPEAAWADAAVAQAKRLITEPIAETLSEVFDGLHGIIEKELVWRAIGRPDVAQRSHRDATSMTDAMRSMGWRTTQQRRGGKHRYCYEKAVMGLPLEWIENLNGFEVVDENNDVGS